MFGLGVAMLLIASVFIFCAHLFDALGEGGGINEHEDQSQEKQKPELHPPVHGA